jgi:pimeloyl-ACP methyl ester carboxylesterase
MNRWAIFLQSATRTEAKNTFYGKAIMIRLILKPFLLMTLTVAAGLSSVIRAQSTTALTGEWVGNSETPGRSEFLRLSLTENAGEFRRPAIGKLSLVQLEGSRVRLELSSLKLVMTGTLAGDEIDGEAEVPGTKARFHLVRTVKVSPEILARYVGAYRFRNGDYLLIDSFADTPDTLWVTDVKSGEARAMFPRSETQFTGGPALRVVSPTRRTLTFRGAGVHVVDLDIKGRQSGAYAIRSPIRMEEVTFKNGDVTLAGTLMTPASPMPASKASRRPAIVFTHGSGPVVREVMWGLGYLYAARGFVVLSYDKRGAGKSTGNWRAASFEQLADDAVAAARFLQSRNEVDPKQIGFWGLSQGGWIAPLAASRFPDAAFAIALSGGGMSPAETELFDTEYELSKAGYTANEIADALTFQRLKNDIIALPSSPSSNAKWEQYAKLRLTAKDAKWFRQPGIDIFGPEKRDDPFWTFMRRSYLYDPAPALRASHAPLLAIFGELDTPKGVQANVRAIRQILDQRDQANPGSKARRDYLVKVYPNGSHNLMEVPPDNPNEQVRLKRFPPGFFETMVDWTTTQLRRRAPARR